MQLDNIIMECGHPASCIMDNVPLGKIKINIAVCQQCFKYNEDAKQKACIVKKKLKHSPIQYPDDGLNLFIGCAACIAIVILLLLLMPR